MNMFKNVDLMEIVLLGLLVFIVLDIHGVFKDECVVPIEQVVSNEK